MKIFLGAVFGLIIGMVLTIQTTPDPQTLQDYTAQVSYLAGRWDQFEYEGDPALRPVIHKVMCDMYQERGLQSPPRNYHPSKFYAELSTLCQTQ